MKKLILFMLAVALFGTSNYAQKAVTKSVPAIQVQGPDMSFESTTVDFGTIEYDSDPFRTAKFVNNGTEPLLIKSASGSCGCTVPTWPKTPILPGETGEIKVRYDTKREGPINKTVTVNTNVEGKSFILSVKGSVKGKATDASVPAGSKNMLNKG